MFENPVRLVKELKGAPLSVLMALFFAGGIGVTQEWIERNTGYSDKPVSKALAYLQEHQFVIKTKSGWMLSDGARQLPLPFQQIEPETEPETPADADLDNSDTNGQGRNISDSPINIKDIKLKDSLKDSNINSETRNFSDFPDLAAELRKANIHENHVTRRLLGRISAGDVRRTVAQVRNDPKHDLSETGWIIAILKGVAEKNDRNGSSVYTSWEL